MLFDCSFKLQGQNMKMDRVFQAKDGNQEVACRV